VVTLRAGVEASPDVSSTCRSSPPETGSPDVTSSLIAATLPVFSTTTSKQISVYVAQ